MKKPHDNVRVEMRPLWGLGWVVAFGGLLIRLGIWVVSLASNPVEIPEE